MTNQLLEFLEERKGKASSVDWHAKKEEWVAAVRRLHAKILDLLGPARNSGAVVTLQTEAELTEDFVGTYYAPVLKLTVGDDRVVFSPQGLHVYGASGRVDLRGDRGVVSLLFMPEKGVNHEWRFQMERAPSRLTVPLDEHSLLDALERVMAP